MKIVTQWQQDLTFTGTNDLGQSITIDGDGKAPSPMHLILMAIGGCSSIDIVMILKKARQNIRDCICEVDAEREENPPRVFTKIHAHYKIYGSNLNPKQVERACNLSMEKYCSASLMLRQAAEIDYTFDIIEES